MTHLFIEGNVRMGKSSLIRTYLHPYIKNLGGFSCQRLLTSHREIIGYRLAPATDLRISLQYSEDLDNVFLIRKNDSMEKNLKVFQEAGMSYLEDLYGKTFILMDEIGGVELLVPEFKHALYRCINGPIPCVGVLKQEEATKSPEVKALNKQLRQDLRDNADTKLLNFQDSVTERQVKAYFDNHLQSL